MDNGVQTEAQHETSGEHGQESSQGDGLGDHDGATLAVSRIAELAPDAFASAPSAPDSTPAPAPTIGRAVLSTGQEIVIDRPCIIGRRPQATRVTGDLPHLFAVPSPQQDISRNHLELRQEGSSVIAVDLQTTNGSMLRRGAADPVRLHPGEPAVVVTGDVIDLGDGVTVTFVELP
nr:FHA domain-containing protein [Demequina sp. TTPB684]